MDKHSESLIEIKTGPFPIIMMVVSFLIAGYGVYCFFVAPQISIIIIALGLFGMYYFKDFLSLEYEFNITNGDVDITKIIAKKRRGSTLAIEEKEIHRLSRTDIDSCKNDLDVKKDQVTYYLAANRKEEDPAAVLYVNHKGKDMILVCDFTETEVKQLHEVLKSKSDLAHKI